MAINYRPKVGEILECNFGVHVIENEGKLTAYHFDGHISPEMIKRRLILVLNGKLAESCIVVPISSTINPKGISQGLHVEIDASHIPITDFYDARKRWAKADTIQYVSNKRLFKIRDKGKPLDLHLPRDLVSEVQTAIVAAINAKALLK